MSVAVTSSTPGPDPDRCNRCSYILICIVRHRWQKINKNKKKQLITSTMIKKEKNSAR